MLTYSTIYHLITGRLNEAMCEIETMTQLFVSVVVSKEVDCFYFLRRLVCSAHFIIMH